MRNPSSSSSDKPTAIQTPEGGIDIVDGQGVQQGVIDPPFLYDQTYAEGAAASGYSTEAVSLSIVEEGSEPVIRLAADPAWLGDPARAYPVVIDPTIRLIGSNADTTIRKAAPTTNYGGDDLLVLKGGTDTHRILYRDTLFEEPVNVLAAEVQLYMATNTTASSARQVSIHEMSAEWLSGEATWNRRKTGVNWKAGGTALPATYAGLGQTERASAGTTTFTNSLLGVSAGADAYTRDPVGTLVGIRGANRSYYLFDGLGSVVALTNASGSVTNSYTYDPFGTTTETKALLTNVFNPWRYTGQYQDTTTGLYKIGARYYQPELGRWTQPDPSGLDANAYAYAASDPINNSDPTGLFCITGTYGGPGGGCRGGSLNERETLEQIAFGQAVKLAVTSFCVAAVGAATAGTALVAGTFACAAAGTVAGMAANKNVDVGIKK